MTTRDIADEARGLPREPTARWILVLVALVGAAWLAVLAWQVRVLPETVPTHFGAGGEPDGWSSRNGALAFSVVLPVVVAFPLPLLSLLVLHRPEWINAPHREWWTATAVRLRRFERLLREDLWLMAALMLGLLAAIQAHITLASLAADGRGPDWLFAAAMISFLVLNGAILARVFSGRYSEQPDPG